jgi:tetratricopeptide (TPR) repeat protein
MLASGCNPHDATTAAPSADAVVRRPLVLPEFSPMTERSVMEQIRERHSSLMLKIENPRTPTVELGNAHGEMGKLLMAAEYLDAAESCYLNARDLVPSDGRWPYYLGHLYKANGELVKSAAFFEQALQLRPDDVATLVWLADVYLAQGRPEAAEPRFAHALSLQPRSLAARFGLAGC